MTAGIRRLVSSRKSQKDMSKGMTEMLGQCCSDLGGVPPTPQLIGNLTTGDRDFMLMKIRAISLGNVVATQMTCPKCQETITFDLDINAFKVRTLTADKDYRIEGDYPIVSLKSEALGVEADLRLPVGHDQAAIIQSVMKDPSLASYELYARLIKSWSQNGVPVEAPNSLKFIDALPLRVFTWLESSFREKQPGPDWFVNVTCEICGKKSPIDMSESDFLFVTPR
jgi:hypothetical protein